MIFKIIQTKKSIAEVDHGDLFPVYESYFAILPISYETLNRILSDSIRMICKWSPFKFMRTGNPRWRSAAGTKINKSKNDNSQESLNEFGSILCHNYPRSYNNFPPIYHPKWLPAAVTKTSKNMKQTISHEPLIYFAKVYVKLMLSLNSLCEGTKQVQHGILWNSCFMFSYLFFSKKSRNVNKDETILVLMYIC